MSEKKSNHPNSEKRGEGDGGCDDGGDVGVVGGDDEAASGGGVDMVASVWRWQWWWPTEMEVVVWETILEDGRALVDVYGEELILRVGDEKLVFNVESTSKYPHKHGDESINQIDIIDTIFEDYFHEVLNVQKSIHPLCGSPTHSSDLVVTSLSLSLTPFGDSDFLLEETNTFIALDLIPPGIDNEIFDAEGDILLLEKLLNIDSTKEILLALEDLIPPEINEEIFDAI
ncbi:hypothetical protein Tco_0697431 [Tanacetum coccineum]